MKHNQIGMSLLESMIVISTLAITFVWGAPSFKDMGDYWRLKSALNASILMLKQAKSLAVTVGQSQHVTFKDGEKWCIGMSDEPECNCRIKTSCAPAQTPNEIDWQDHTNVTISNITMGKDNAVVFDGDLGLSLGHAGSAIFSTSKYGVKLIVSNLGRVRLCMIKGNMVGLQKC